MFKTNTEALGKDSDNPETLVNLIVVCSHTSRPTEVAKRYVAQLKDVAPDHAYTKYYGAKEEMFVRCAEQYAAA